MTHTMVVGTTEAQDFALRDSGVALVGTGFTVAIEFRTTGLTSVQLDATEDVIATWLDQAAGTVRVTGMETLPLGEYRFRFTLTDGASDVGYVPNESESDRWRVVRV